MAHTSSQIAASQSTHRKLTLRQRALWMRRHPTLSEQALWLRLRRKQVLGVQFRRQVIVGGNYIADFAASSISLIVEVDGGYHAERSRVRLDAKRERKLRREGYHVLRLPHELVVQQPEIAVARVHAVVERLLAAT